MRLLMCLIAVSLCLTGCSVFLPKHPNSMARDGERITINMLERTDLCNSDKYAQYREIYERAFKIDHEDQRLAGLCPSSRYSSGVEIMAITAAAGLAIDMVSSELQREASDYEAQFKLTVTGDKFWVASTGQVLQPVDLSLQTNPITQQPAPKSGVELSGKVLMQEEVTECVSKNYSESSPNGKNKLSCKDVKLTSTRTTKADKATYVHNYGGIEITRRVKGESEPVFKFVALLFPSADQQMLRMKPLLFQTTKSKAKVLGDNWWTWLPPMIFGKMFRDGGHSIDTEISLRIDAYWRGQDQNQHISSVAASTFTISDYDIEVGPELISTQIAGDSGWLLAVLISYTATGAQAVPTSDGGAGTFSVEAVVTEKDHSNAKRYLEQGVRYLKDNKNDFVTRIGQAVTR